jgi:hypothetical protein
MLGYVVNTISTIIGSPSKNQDKQSTIYKGTDFEKRVKNKYYYVGKVVHLGPLDTAVGS